jgi:heat shock protein HtpX
VLASVIVAWFSRRREFRADAGGAKLEGRDAMIAALARLSGNPAATTLPKEVQAFGISGTIGKLLSTHPPIEQRIAALKAG